LENAQLEAFVTNLKSDLQHRYRTHEYEEEEWKQKLEVEEGRVLHLSNSLAQMKEALGSTHLSLVQLQGAHQENQALIEALDNTKERLGKFEITSLVLAKDNSEIPNLKSHNMSLHTELGQKAEQLHLVSEALIRSQLENSFLPGLRADKDRLEAECSHVQAQLANAETEVAQQVQRLQELSQLPKSVHALEAQRTMLQNRLTEVSHASKTWEERAMRAQSLLSETEAEVVALRKERGDLLVEVVRVNKGREEQDVELYQCRTALEQITHDYRAHTYCHVKLSKEIQLREKVEQELFEFQAAHANCKEDTRQLRLQSMKLAAAPAPGTRTPIVGVGILLGKYDKHSQKAGRIYILKLTPNSPAMELYMKSKAEKELPDIADHDVLIKVDGNPVQGMDLDLVFDAIRGNKFSKVGSIAAL
jgi:chromosome segregation ATPase